MGGCGGCGWAVWWGGSGSQAAMAATGLYGCCLSYHLFCALVLLQDTPQEDCEVGIGIEFFLFQGLFILFPDF